MFDNWFWNIICVTLAIEGGSTPTISWQLFNIILLTSHAYHEYNSIKGYILDKSMNWLTKLYNVECNIMYDSLDYSYDRENEKNGSRKYTCSNADTSRDVRYCKLYYIYLLILSPCNLLNGRELLWNTIHTIWRGTKIQNSFWIVEIWSKMQTNKMLPNSNATLLLLQ